MINCERRSRTIGSRARSRGYGFVFLLIVIAIVGLTLAAATEVYRTSVMRDKEQQLLFAGREFREAIRRYYDVSPQGQGRYPPSLEDLLRDPRSAGVKRHLRRIYVDPMTGSAEWGLMIVNGGIAGVHSMSEKEPFKVANFEPLDASFANAARYADWVFTHPPDLVVKQESSPGSAATPSNDRKPR